MDKSVLGYKLSDKYHIIAENPFELFWVIDTNFNIKYASSSHQTFLDFQPESLVNTPLFELIHPNDRELARNQLKKIIKSQVPIQTECQLRHGKRDFINAELRGYPITDDDGVLKEAIIIAHDITERKNTELALKESEERYRSLVELSPLSVAVHVEGIIVYINQAGVELTGATHADEIIGKSILDFVPLHRRDIQLQRLNETLGSNLPLMTTETKLLRLDGQVIEIEAISTKVHYQGKEAVQSINIDITERKKTEEKIKHLAYHDTLTDLPNRRYFHRLLTEKIETASKNQVRHKFAVLFIDIDNFKQINDCLNHSYGDQLLQQVSRRLTSCVDDNNIVARFSGDEFVILVPEISNRTDIENIAKNILSLFRNTFNIDGIDGYEINITPSIGIAIYPTDGEDPETLVKNADVAMYMVKNEGKNNFEFYNQLFHKEIINQKKLEQELREAIKLNQFSVYFQPVYNALSEQMIEAEALIRWEHPQKGLVPPSEFIPIAEETGLIAPIGEWVLRESCKQNKIWQEAGYRRIAVRVNLSTLQFFQTDIIKTVSDVLNETGLEAHYLELEVTESIMIENKNRAVELLHDLKRIGVKLSLDDFGTGFSSLGYLKDLPIDTIKIDRSFIWDMFNDSKSEAIVATMINLANSLGLQVVAEGVETKEQLDHLRNQKCEKLQGFWYSKPLPSDVFKKFLEDQS